MSKQGLPAKSGAPPRWIGRALKRLIKLAGDWDIDVEFEQLDGSSGLFIPDDMEIYIDSRLPGRDRINYLLHELGHASIHIDGLTRDRFNVFDDDAKTPRQRLTLIEEEFEAWYRGRAIARLAGIRLDESYELAREAAMISYVKWCASDGYAKIGGWRSADQDATGAVCPPQTSSSYRTGDTFKHPSTNNAVVNEKPVDEQCSGHADVHGLARLGIDSSVGRTRTFATCAETLEPRGVPLLKATVQEGVAHGGEGETSGSLASIGERQRLDTSVPRNALRLPR